MSAKQPSGASKRPRGTGSLYTRRDKQGRETWYARWYEDGRRVKRRVGLRRKPGTTEGLTKPEAERRLADIRQGVAAEVAEDRTAGGDRPTIEEVARLLIDARSITCKPATVEAYRTAIDRHIVRPLGTTADDPGARAYFDADLRLDEITTADVNGFVRTKLDDGLAPKSVLNYWGALFSLFEFAIAEDDWAITANPCKSKNAVKPRVKASGDFKYLTLEELEAVVRAAPASEVSNLQELDRVLYLTAAQTGLRQGELIALRWRDVDWSAQRIRVRRNFSRKEFGTPKTTRSSRAVPLPTRVAQELERWSKISKHVADDDLVFAYPSTGRPYDRSKLLKRYTKARKAAGVTRRVTFHGLRHTYGTQMAAAGTSMRTLQELMGHTNLNTTQIYADYAPSEHEVHLVDAAFGTPGIRGAEAADSLTP